MDGSRTSLLDAELARFEWGRLRQSYPPNPADLPELVRALHEAPTPGQAEGAYFALEGACFPQGMVFEAGRAVASCLLAALAGGAGTRHCQGWILEALQWLCCGEPARAEVDAGNVALVEDIRSDARAGLWLLYSIHAHGHGEDRLNAARVLHAIKTDEPRLRMVVRGFPALVG